MFFHCCPCETALSPLRESEKGFWRLGREEEAEWIIVERQREGRKGVGDADMYRNGFVVGLNVAGGGPEVARET